MEKKKRIEIGVTGFFIIVALFMIISRLGARGKSKYAKGSAGGLTSTPASSAEFAKEKVLFWELDKKSQNLALVRDPFSVVPIAPTKKGSHGLSLNGIAWDKERPIAVVNETILGVGDRIEGYIVIKITRDSVILNDGSKDFELNAE